MSTKSLTLYEVEDNLQAYLDTEADVPADMQAEFQAALSAAGAAALDKRDAVIRAFQAIDAQVEFCKAEKKRIGDRQATLENGLKRFRRYLASVLATLPEPPMKGKKQPARKLEGRIGAITLRRGSEKLDILDAQKLPLPCCSVSVTLPATAWRMLLDYWESQLSAGEASFSSVTAQIGAALACAPVTILPDDDKIKAYIEQQQASLENEDFDLAIAETAEEKAAIRERIARQIAAETGARIVTGEPTVQVK